MKIAVFGSGYVGLVTGTCFAELGNQVIGIDVDSKRIAKLNQGISPIFEPGLNELLKKNLAENRLNFSLDAKKAIIDADIIFIAVGTPSDEDGSADLKYVKEVAKTIGQYINDYRVIVDKSTVPVGSADLVKDIIKEAIKTRNQNIDFDVVSNPEFLKEGSAIQDCMFPDRIIIGSDSSRAIEMMHALYAPLNQNHDKILNMSIRSAELTKYASNAMLATKISFMNEMSRIAEHVGADIEEVRIGIGSDPRIGFQFINPGPGYGGSCFPKDVQALSYMAKASGYKADILQAVHEVNLKQKQVLAEKIKSHFGSDLSGKTIALWGLAFKPNTDDIREASSLTLMENLWQHGATVQAYDPEAMPNIAKHYGERKDLILCDSAESSLENADALVIITEWTQFKSPDFQLIKRKLKSPVIFDGRNLYDPQKLQALGFTYYAIGRPIFKALQTQNQ